MAEEDNREEKEEEIIINPWSSKQFADYGRLMEQFGIMQFDFRKLPGPPSPQPPAIFRRGIIFGQRGFSSILRAIEKKRPFVILTGLAPSGKMHLGHKMVIDQVKYFQALGGRAVIAVADFEALAARDVPLEDGKRIAIEEYLINYIALGLEPENTEFYFQSSRDAVKDFAYIASSRVNLGQMLALYGFEQSTSIAHIFTPLVQVADILHVQLKQYGGPAPTLVPVGVDQDPHIRLTRDIAQALRIFSVIKTKDNRYGAFVRIEENVEAWLDRAEAVAAKLGFSKLKKVPKYKALYIEDMVEEKLEELDEEIARMEAANGESFHRFITGLTGEKMSSSRPATSIFLTDTAEEAKKKIMASKTGGRESIEMQRKLGGEYQKCPVYELFVYHFVPDDEELNRITVSCSEGKRLCGECKKEACSLALEFLKNHQEKRKNAPARLQQYFRDNRT
ncbi:MAG: tryptophan--tRNA ligase [Thermoplasmata archaeon]